MSESIHMCHVNHAFRQDRPCSISRPTSWDLSQSFWGGCLLFPPLPLLVHSSIPSTLVHYVNFLNAKLLYKWSDSKQMQQIVGCLLDGRLDMRLFRHPRPFASLVRHASPLSSVPLSHVTWLSLKFIGKPCFPMEGFVCTDKFVGG